MQPFPRRFGLPAARDALLVLFLASRVGSVHPIADTRLGGHHAFAKFRRSLLGPDGMNRRPLVLSLLLDEVALPDLLNVLNRARLLASLALSRPRLVALDLLGELLQAAHGPARLSFLDGGAPASGALLAGVGCLYPTGAASSSLLDALECTLDRLVAGSGEDVAYVAQITTSLERLRRPQNDNRSRSPRVPSVRECA
jgi:hypothetical protein